MTLAYLAFGLIQAITLFAIVAVEIKRRPKRGTLQKKQRARQVQRRSLIAKLADLLAFLDQAGATLDNLRRRLSGLSADTRALPQIGRYAGPRPRPHVRPGVPANDRMPRRAAS